MQHTLIVSQHNANHASRLTSELEVADFSGFAAAERAAFSAGLAAGLQRPGKAPIVVRDSFRRDAVPSDLLLGGGEGQLDGRRYPTHVVDANAAGSERVGVRSERFRTHFRSTLFCR